MKKSYVVVAAAILIVGGGLYGFSSLKKKLIADYIAKAAVAPISVLTGEAATMDWPEEIETIGALSARRGLDLTFETSGVVKDVLIKSGASVAAGSPLVRLADEFERAIVRQAEAELKLAQLSYDRIRQLQRDQIVSTASGDQVQTRLAEAQANYERAQITLSRKTVVAPFSGVVGISRIGPGEYVNPGSVISSLEDNSVMRVNFNLPEQQIEKVAAGMAIEIFTSAYAGRIFKGRISAIDPKLDSATRMLRLQAEFENPTGELRAGMSASVRIPLPVRSAMLVVPQTAISYSLWGDSVFVVGQSKAGEEAFPVERRVLKILARRGDFAMVGEGLKAGERIVLEGHTKLSSESKVVPLTRAANR